MHLQLYAGPKIPIFNTIQLPTKQNNEFAYIYEIISVTFPTTLNTLHAILRCSETVSEKTPTVFLPQTTNLSFYTTKIQGVLVFFSTNTRLRLLLLSKKLLHLSFSCEKLLVFKFYTLASTHKK
jgi:hypothetical protein